MCVWVRETEMGGEKERERDRECERFCVCGWERQRWGRESEMRKRESDYLCESKSKQEREKNEVR